MEKPAGRNAAETRAICDAVRAGGVHSAAGFNYRNAPAVELATALACDDATFIAQRPKAGLDASHFSRGTGGELGEVETRTTSLLCCALRGLSRNTRVEQSIVRRAVHVWHRGPRRTRRALLGLPADG